MDNLYLIIFIGLSGFILFLFFYILSIEKRIERKFASIELGLEELNKEVFLLKKKLKENESIKAIEKIEEIIETVVDDIKYMEEKNTKFYKKVEEKIASLEYKIKKSPLNNCLNISKHEEDKILSLFKKGYSVEEISRELRIPAGEIELVLKFSNF